METEGKVSKVAICETCQSHVMASHVDYLTKVSEKEFTKLSNDGFTVKLETIEETRARNFSSYKHCTTVCARKQEYDESKLKPYH